MGDKTGIIWTDATWNPVTGCTKVSAGCKNCYAERDWARLAANPKTSYYGRKFADVRYNLGIIEQPLRWNKPRRIFVCSMSDLFHEAVPDLVIADVFAIMAAAPHHTFQVLTKRPKRALALLRDAYFIELVYDALALHSDADLVWPLPNVWFGVTTEDQAAVDERVPLLMRIPAAVRWLSIEPLVGPISFVGVFANGVPNDGTNALERIDWVVVAGESGPKARPMHPEWVRELRDQCAACEVPFLFKQWGEWVPRGPESLGYPVVDNAPRFRMSANGCDGQDLGSGDGSDDVWMNRAGKKAAGRLLDGVLHDAYPESAS